MPLTKTQREKLRDAGFMPFEIRRISNARTPDGSFQEIDISGPAWQSTIESRRTWVASLIRAGWSKDDIRASLRRYYRRRRGRSPFDFLKIEYRPPKRLTDFQYALKLRSRSRITRDLGRGYGRAMRQQLRPLQ